MLLKDVRNDFETGLAYEMGLYMYNGASYR